MYKIAKEFSFSMGHRLSLHDGLCKNFHGHNYKVIVGVKTNTLNDNGMVIDFSDLKTIVNNYLKHFDHAMMINENDKLAKSIPDTMKVIIVPYEPTAENMAKELYLYVKKELGYENDLMLDFVTIYETDKSQATYLE